MKIRKTRGWVEGRDVVIEVRAGHFYIVMSLDPKVWQFRSASGGRRPYDYGTRRLMMKMLRASHRRAEVRAITHPPIGAPYS